MKTNHFSAFILLLVAAFLLAATPARAQSVSIIGDVSPSPASSPVWEVDGEIIVGNVGTGTLLIEGGGSASNTGNGFIGYFGTSGSENSVTVTGTGSLWSNGGELTVGGGSTGTLRIENGGSVSNTSDGFIGHSATGSESSVTVTGTGSLWSNGNHLVVGWQGSNNSLTVKDGALVTVANHLGFSFFGGTNNHLRLDGGYLAWKGDKLSYVSDYLAGGFIQVWDGLGWQDAADSNLFNFLYFGTEEAAFAFTGYTGLGGYTILTSTVVPEPSTVALLIGAGTLALAISRRHNPRKR